MFGKSQAPFTCAASFFMTLQPILVSLSKNTGGRGFDYSVPISTLLSEALKLVLSSSLLLVSMIRQPFSLLHDESISEFFSFMVPGAIYFLNNNMIFLILQLLKGRPTTSIHWQNVQMYIWGVLFNFIGAYLKDGAEIRDHGILGGFTMTAWSVVVCNALNGLAISAVLKFADNIARVYAHAIAMMLTMSISVQLFGSPVTPQLVIAVVLVATSTLQYNLPSEAISSVDENSALLSADDQSEVAEETCMMTSAQKSGPAI
ncbi:MAG: hypothetical protein SGPRY_002132 [Prymnesium sp.]